MDRPIRLLGTCHQHNAVPVSGKILQSYIQTTNFTCVECPSHMKHYTGPHDLQFGPPKPKSANRDLGDHEIAPQKNQTLLW